MEGSGGGNGVGGSKARVDDGAVTAATPARVRICFARGASTPWGEALGFVLASAAPIPHFLLCPTEVSGSIMPCAIGVSSATSCCVPGAVSLVVGAVIGGD